MLEAEKQVRSEYYSLNPGEQDEWLKLLEENQYLKEDTENLDDQEDTIRETITALEQKREDWAEKEVSRWPNAQQRSQLAESVAEWEDLKFEKRLALLKVATQQRDA